MRSISCDRCYNAVGFCHFKEHKGYITKDLLKQHDCLNKGCHYFQVFEDTEYWRSYCNGRKRKKLRKYYAKHKDEWFFKRGWSMDKFLGEVLKVYRGSYTNIPYDLKTDSIDISEFLSKTLS